MATLEEKLVLKKEEHKLRNQILNTALNIEGFKHFNELKKVSGYCHLATRDKNMMLQGFILILSELENDISLQHNTLLATMINVKKQYGVLTKFKHTMADMCAITLAIANVRTRLTFKSLWEAQGLTYDRR